MNELKYYWISYCTKEFPYEACIDIHPFTFMKDLNNVPTYIFGEVRYHYLNSWKLISVEEYNLWRELNSVD